MGHSSLDQQRLANKPSKPNPAPSSLLRDVITFAVGALGGISMLVGLASVVLSVIVGVRERTAEIGLT